MTESATEPATRGFIGCKIAVFYQGKILVYKRDQRPEISFPDAWDFPGGGRERQESPEVCVLRELHEEFALSLSPERLSYKRRVPGQTGVGWAYFFVTEISDAEYQSIHFGDEGQYWALMSPADYLQAPDAIPANQQRLQDYLTANSETFFTAQIKMHEAAYLVEQTPRAQSGFGRSESEWERYRRPIAEAVTTSGSFSGSGLCQWLFTGIFAALAG